VLKLVATMLEEQACYLIGVSLAGFGKILFPAYPSLLLL
jgi:hypothetical protein